MRPVIVRDDDDLPPPRQELGSGGGGFRFVTAIAVLLFALIFARSIAGFFIELAWWNEIGQVETWYSLLSYRITPFAVVAVLIFVVLWAAHARGVRSSGARLRDHAGYAKMATLFLGGVSLFLALAFTNSWTMVRYFGGKGETAAQWSDPVFNNPLGFYLFDLPFYSMMLRLLVVLSIATIVVYWLSARGWRLREKFRNMRRGGDIEIQELGLQELLESKLVRVMVCIALLGFALQTFLGRYDLLTEDHTFMVGVDYVSQNVTLPLIWLAIAAFLAAAAFLLMRRLTLAGLAVIVAIAAPSIFSRIVNWAHVRPNEISIQRPYIERHIAGTRAAYGLDRRTREVEFAAKMDAPFNAAKHRATLDNVRLWDWKAFHDTVTQIQALRPYYVFADSDVDRYQISDGNGPPQMRQVLVTPRELDVQQLPDVRTRWINPHFIYTHGYGVVLAEANRITADGLPLLFIQNAPPEIRSKNLTLKRPEIYYGEAVHEPVFVRTAQEEFDYPSGSDNKHTRYEGKGGFPISSLPMRIAAALREGDWNILLTNYLTGESRMMIHRKINDRLNEVAGFLEWDEDPYLVVTKEGRLVWMADGYTTSDAHPYSRSVRTSQFGRINYIRNSVKATIDAYDGSIAIYVFDEADPIIRAYRRLFPALFQPASAMSADLRSHARYPEAIFRVQAELYRTFHMRDPEAFYNKEDLWDISRNSSAGGEAASAVPTYVVASLPDSSQPEFLLMIPFTPRNKDNLIGLMVARCDGEHLGEIVFLQLSKQELIFGPMQVRARINQDQTIAKDLSLWNQQGSKVIRGQTLVLPIDNTFLYVEPIYLQASQAPMPQLKKVALASGSQLAYADTYGEALRQLESLRGMVPSPPAESSGAPPPSKQESRVANLQDARVEEARSRLRRYRELMSQGKFADAGKELEAIEQLLK
jgi:uncharacterized membrane protein (UPF0182 family)